MWEKGPTPPSKINFTQILYKLFQGIMIRAKIPLIRQLFFFMKPLYTSSIIIFQT
jgi:hypothetical protein